VSAELSERLDPVLAGTSAGAEVDVPLDGAGSRRWLTVRATPLRSTQGGAVVMHTDVTERRRYADDLQRQASRDGLTGLLNRTSFEAGADDLLARAVDRSLPVTMLFIDLDGFKAVNDAHGHAVGDAVLQATAATISGVVRPGDLVGRLGGDEFVVLLAPGISGDDAHLVASRLVAALATPSDIAGRSLRTAASVGMARVEDATAVTRADLIGLADRAMYQAKHAGGARLVEAPG
jgi:diguanylate cyclase (GGDEF)-like protein